ncbi:DUF6531 domain-containing protein [Streptomyces alboflavus]|uniref:DUF6531 domain-containing protein n=1 Tax=Streptomyces alboflavus TaxID=67267 RepID=UPI00133171C6|nr:DUF6531 domain-containing protein [Streptomyces alboflavus]
MYIDLPQAGRQQVSTDQIETAPAGAVRTSKPLKPAKAMTRKQRQAQVERARLLDVFSPKVRASKGFAAASVKALRHTAAPKVPVVKRGERLRADDGSRGRGKSGDQAPPRQIPSPTAASADAEHPYIEAAWWWGRYENYEEDQLPPAGVKVKVPANTPVSPKTYFNAQPGRTSLNFSVDWTGTAADAPAYVRLQLYRASDDKLVATRLVSHHATESQGDTQVLCTNWLPVDVPVKTCAAQVTDGVLAGKSGTDFYAKMSFGTEHERHYYKFPDVPKTWQQYYLPTKWTSSATTPTGTAWYTPGIAGGMGGNCTCDYQSYRADPVNTATGVVRETVTDAEVPGKGLPVRLTRHYASDSKETGGLFGKGWRLSYETNLNVATDSATLTDIDGATVKFSKKSDGTYTAPKPVRYTLAAVADGFTLTSADHTRQTFDKAGKLTGWVDGSGKGLTLDYTDGRLTKVTDAAGRDTTFKVDAASGRLEEAVLPDGRSVKYQQVDGQLGSATGAEGGTTKYTYQGGRLATVVDPNGNTVTRNTYDSDTGRINKQIDASGGTYKFKWTPTPKLPQGSGESEMTDPAGGLWTDTYEAGVLTNSYAPDGGGTQRGFDRHLNITTARDSANTPTNVTYDDRGNIATATKAGVTKKTEFDSADRLHTVTNGRGAKSTITYEGDSDRVKSMTGPPGTLQYTYTSDGQVETQTSPGGGVTRYSYDGRGLLTSVTKPEGGRTSYTYNTAGRVKTETEPRGNTDGADAAEYTTTYEYFPNGRLKSVTDPKKNTTSFTYDDNGNTKTVTDAKNRVTKYGYNAANQLETVTNPDGTKTTTGYDTRGNATSEVDAAGGKTTYKYDAAGRLAAVTSPRGNASGADPAKFTTTYGYDDNGNQDEVVDPAGGRTSTSYNDLDQPEQVTDPMGRTTLTRYDANGNVTEVTDPLKQITTYTYTDANQLRTVTNPLKKTTTYGYDADGNQSSSETHLGRKTTWEYDKDGRLARQTDARGNVAGAKPEDYTTQYAYDLAGHNTTVTDPLGNKATTQYNTLGQVSARIAANDKRTGYGYNELGQLETVTAADGGVTTYRYDTAGNLHTRADDNKHTTTYGYDDARRLTSVTDSLDHKVTHKYDLDGNQYLTTNARGTTSTTTFNANNWPTEIDYSDGTPDVKFTYFADGSRRTITDATGTRTLAYYDDGNLKSVSAPGQSTGFNYAYDAAGQLKERTYPDGRKTTFTYTSDGNRDSSTTDGAKTTYGYTAARQLSRTTLPTTNGYEEKRTYDRAGRLTDVASVKGDTTLSAWHAELDPLGRPQRIDATRGTEKSSKYHTYDATGRLLTECTATTQADSCPADAPTTSYTYDKVGNRQTRTDTNGATTSYRYDAADQLTETTAGATTTGYAYDADGNQTKAGATTLAYDATNQLTGVTTSAATYSYTYDADGLRTTAKKNDTKLRTNTWDINYEDGLARQATESNGSGALIADYQYNPEDQIQGQTTSAGAFYHHHDLLGSVTDLTDSTGAHQTKYSYGAYGEVTTDNIATSPPANRFTYTGEYKEPTTGAAGYYLRARSYTPDTGRFTTRDPLTPDPEKPHTQPYAYADNAPNYLTDPTGQCSWNPFSNDKSCYTEKIPGSYLIPLSPAFDKIGSAWANMCKNGSDYAKANGRAGWTGCIDEFTGIGPIRRGVDSFRSGGIADGIVQCLGGAGQFGLFLLSAPRVPGGGAWAYQGAGRAGGNGLSTGGVQFATGTVWERIAATQPPYQGTILPKSFNLTISSGRQIWVHPNATKHIIEEVKYSTFSQHLKTEDLVASLVRAIDGATRNGIQFGRRIEHQKWELIIVPSKGGSGNPVLKHARRLG